MLHEFDRVATCKLEGFAEVAEYYQAGSSGRHIPLIRTPCLFLSAIDDPFLGELPVQACRSNEATVRAGTKASGPPIR